jgi:predicted small secreted protein
VKALIKTLLIIAILMAALIALSGCNNVDRGVHQLDKQLNSPTLQRAPQQPAQQPAQPTQSVPSPTASASPSASSAASATASASAQGGDQKFAMQCVQNYYAAAASGDYGYTYSHLSVDDQAKFSEAQWDYANRQLGSAGASYQVTNVYPVTSHAYGVDLVVNGSPRTTTFVMQYASYVHALSPTELSLFEGQMGEE